jgi:hypothetical protein
MSDSEHHERTRRIPDAEHAAKTNPKVDVEKVREAQVLLEELRKAGVSRQEYEISSPYERKPLRARPKDRTREA